jgi:hypothetical protein
LATKWDTLAPKEKVYLSGKAIGKHGGDIFIPGASVKIISEVGAVQKVASVNRKIMNAKKTLPLEKAAQSYPSNLTGRKGWELKEASFQDRIHTETIIEGNCYSGHAVDQMQRRGIYPSVVKNIIETQVPKVGREVGTLEYFDTENNILIIVNSESKKIITVGYRK